MEVNWNLVLAILPFVLFSLVTGLRDYEANRSWLHALIAVLSVLTPKDSPGTLKLPFTMPVPPENRNA